MLILIFNGTFVIIKWLMASEVCLLSIVSIQMVDKMVPILEHICRMMMMRVIMLA